MLPWGEGVGSLLCFTHPLGQCNFQLAGWGRESPCLSALNQEQHDVKCSIAFVPPRHYVNDMPRASVVIRLPELNRAIRAAWRTAGRIPTWPAVLDPKARPSRTTQAQAGITQRTFDLLRPVFHLIGVEADTELARRSGGPRSQICWIRHSLHIPARPAVVITPAQRRECLRRVRARESLKSIAAVTGLTVQTVKTLALPLGWTPEWTKHHARPKRSNTVGRLSRIEMERLLRAGKKLREVADLAGVSAQRIVQVAKAIGMPGQHELSRPQREKRRRERERERELKRRRRAKERAARPAKLLATLRRYLGRARQLYDKGLSISDIAKRYQIPPQSMSWWLFRGRRQLGWFPRRRAD